MQASAGIAEVNTNVAQSTVFSAEIASDIAEVSRIAGVLAGNSTAVSTNADDLNRLAMDLKVMIGEFKIEGAAGTHALVSFSQTDLIDDQVDRKYVPSINSANVV
jgi:hypothetical protein